jgi:hypothetical protein
MFGTVASPSDKVLPTFATTSPIDDFLYKKFFETIDREDRLWLSVLAGRKEGGVVRNEWFEFG